MGDKIRKAFVTGWPVSHSLSPALHTYWLNQYDINGSYEKIALEPDALDGFLNDLPVSQYIGGNITIPHKETGFDLVAKCSPTARKLQAINTIWVDKGILRADNTDGYGFSANLDDFSTNWRTANTALIIGAGGAARAIALSLVNAGIKKIVITNRTLPRAQTLAVMMGSNCKACSIDELSGLLETTQLLVNTTSMGMINQPQLDIDLAPLPKTAIVTDIVYNPLQTPLLKQAASLNLVAIDGIGMLMHQAVPGFEKWFGIRPQVTPQLRKYMLKKLTGTKP